MPAPAILATWIGDTKDIVQTVAIVVAGLWFLVQWFMRRQLDAAIEFEVEVRVFANQSRSPGTCVVELAAVVKNATIVGAGVKALTWSISAVTEGFAPLENQSWLPAARERLILTRDTTWRLSALADSPLNRLVKLQAFCEIDWQPSRQTIRYEKVFLTAADDKVAPGTSSGSSGT